MILNSFETYVYLAGALAIGVLAIEVLLCDKEHKRCQWMSGCEAGSCSCGRVISLWFLIARGETGTWSLATRGREITSAASLQCRLVLALPQFAAVPRWSQRLWGPCCLRS